MSATEVRTAARTRVVARRRPWSFPWIVAEGQIAFTLLSALGFGLVIAAVVAGIAWKSTITSSIWESATNAIPWFSAVLAGHTLFQVVPMMIANGRTRRAAMIDAAQVIGATTVVITLLTTLGYLIEWAVYRWQGWPRSIGGGHFFTTHSQVGAIFWETLLTMAIWSALGAMVGIAFYRYDQYGWLALIPAAGVMVLTGVFMTTRTPVFDNVMDRYFSDWGRSLPVATLGAVLGLAITGALIWRIVRDLPLRPWR
ncbi:MAG: hypothetical protein WBA46_11810 [Thermomicrobiales bacterium]